MGTEILRPQDCLIERIRVPPASFVRRKSYYGNPVPNQNYVPNPRPRKQVVRSDPRRIHVQPAVVSKRSSSEDLRGFKMEKVTILRRGESLDSKTKGNNGGLVVTGTERLGPDPEMVPKQVRIVDLKPPVEGKTDMYAGSAFAVSPEPSELPLPSFSKKKQVSKVVDGDSATRDLRRLLRLD
ncbi:hypothetical protein GBA52_004316 [Prunus armeniaca]|nr:hypothetical protein GBA52_004316 [Prunus armeniaca]